MSNDYREWPIIFSGAMVRAILAGTKTQTRRVITSHNYYIDGGPAYRRIAETLELDTAWIDPGPSPAGNVGPYLKARSVRENDEFIHRIYPKIQPGDRLYVRESFARIRKDDYYSDDPAGVVTEYKADSGAKYPGEWPDDSGDDPDCPRWKPAIHMLKIHARIWLDVVSVRPERLHDISEFDAKSEGVGRLPGGTYRQDFHTLWDEINAARGYPWSSNPWIWRIEFKRGGRYRR